MTQSITMADKTVPVKGANFGIGKALADVALARGAHAGLRGHSSALDRSGPPP
jgi:NAD(P)-dependent dehydrogenase (short-subunit alcohol dehydrogenase family)